VTESFDWSALVERLCGPPDDPHVEQPPPSPVAPTLWD